MSIIAKGIVIDGDGKMTYDREFLKESRELAWEEYEMGRQMKALYIDGTADFFIGFKAEEIPTMIEAFEKLGNSRLVNALKEMQKDGVGWDRQIVEMEEEE